MKKIKLIIMGLAVIFLATGIVYAQAQGTNEKKGEEHKGRITKELNLTLEQEKKLAENRKAQRGEMERLRAAIKEKQVKFQEELKSPTVTRAAIEPLANEIKSLQAQLIDSRINGIFAVKEILTPEQFAKFQQMAEKVQKERKGNFHNWREKGMGGDLNKEQSQKESVK